MVKSSIVLGHVISKEGIKVDRAKVDLIDNLPPPQSVKEVWSFLGHAGFCRRFIKNFSQLSRPLTSLLAKDQTFEFSKECLESFKQLKKELTNALIV